MRDWEGGAGGGCRVTNGEKWVSDKWGAKISGVRLLHWEIGVSSGEKVSFISAC